MAQIRVLEVYIGYVTDGRRIEPGVYPIGDAALFGAEDILLAKRKAELISGEPMPAPASLEEADDDAGDEEAGLTPEGARAALEAAYRKQDKDTLEKLASSFSLVVTGTGANGGVLKEDVVQALVAHDLTAQGDDDQGEDQTP